MTMENSRRPIPALTHAPLSCVLLVVACVRPAADPPGDGNFGNLDVLPQTDSRPRNWMVSTLAGTGSPGFRDGLADTAMFYEPRGLAVDENERVYVADLLNHRIRVVDKGIVTTVAGNGKEAYADGPALSASFDEPSSVAVDRYGRLYVADAGNYRIRLVGAGMVITIAGSGVQGDLDGPTATASFMYPLSVSVNGNGHVYVGDMNRVRLISDGKVTTLAGDGVAGYRDGPAHLAQFHYPLRAVLDAAGTIYVADGGNSSLRTIVDNTVTTLSGNGKSGYVDGPLAYASFGSPFDLVLTADALYVADAVNYRVRTIANGQVSTLAGSGPVGSGAAGFADGPALSARFGLLVGLAQGPSGAMYVADLSNHRIRIITPVPADYGP